MGIIHILFYFAVILLLTKPLGSYMHAVFEGQGALSKRVFDPVERVIYRVFMVDEKAQMDWKRYALCMVLFSTISMFAAYAILRFQGSRR
jgi:K+-transporting ATPase ATPase A chain